MPTTVKQPDNTALLNALDSLDTPAETLRAIYQHPDMRRNRNDLLAGILAHPNCPPDIFAAHVWTHPEAVCANPAWDLLRIENPRLLHLDNNMEVLFVLRNAALPRKFVEALSYTSHKKVKQATSQHVAVAGEVTKNTENGADWEAELAQYLVTNLHRDARLKWLKRAGYLPSWIENHLPYPIKATGEMPTEATFSAAEIESMEARMKDLESEDPWRWWKNFPHTTLPPSVLRLFLRGADREACRTLSDKDTSTILAHFAASKGELVPLIALSQVTARALLFEASAHCDWHRRLGAALNPQIPRKPLFRLTTDGNRWVRVVAQKRWADPKWVFGQ
jgi:hypothetical protein